MNFERFKNYAIIEAPGIVKLWESTSRTGDLVGGVTTSGRAGGLRYEPLKADCFKPPKGRQPRIKLTGQFVDLQILDV